MQQNGHLKLHPAKKTIEHVLPCQSTVERSTMLPTRAFIQSDLYEQSPVDLKESASAYISLFRLFRISIPEIHQPLGNPPQHRIVFFCGIIGVHCRRGFSRFRERSGLRSSVWSRYLVSEALVKPGLPLWMRTREWTEVLYRWCSRLVGSESV